MHLDSIEKLNGFSGVIESEAPNQSLLSFEGVVKTGNNVIPIGINSLLLRGSVLRNTDYAYGLVLYTGSNTKIMKNLKKAGQKRSRLEISLNRFVFAAFLFNLALLISSVILEVLVFYNQRNLQSKNPNYLWYLATNFNSVQPADVRSD